MNPSSWVRFSFKRVAAVGAAFTIVSSGIALGYAWESRSADGLLAGVLMQHCDRAAWSTDSYCNCLITSIQARYALSDFHEMRRTWASGDAQRVLSRIRDDCASPPVSA